MKSFQEIYRQEIAYVWSCLRRLGVEEKSLEDKAHDVFMVFYRKRRVFDVTRPVRPWLCGIAARVALDHNRLAYKKREVLSDQVAVDMAIPNPEAAMERSEARRYLLMALDVLDIERRTVLVLHDIEGRSIPEIAEIVNAPINTLYSRLRLARQQLTGLLKRESVKRCGT